MEGYICDHVTADGVACDNRSFAICHACGDPGSEYYCPAHLRPRRLPIGHRAPPVVVPDTMASGPLPPTVLAARQRSIWQDAEDANAAAAARLCRHGTFTTPP